MQCQCLDRLIDPKTDVILAAYGWIQERRELPRKYWVRIESRPTQYFSREEAAKTFYEESIEPLIQKQLQQARSRRETDHAI